MSVWPSTVNSSLGLVLSLLVLLTRCYYAEEEEGRPARGGPAGASGAEEWVVPARWEDGGREKRE